MQCLPVEFHVASHSSIRCQRCRGARTGGGTPGYPKGCPNSDVANAIFTTPLSPELLAWSETAEVAQKGTLMACSCDLETLVRLNPESGLNYLRPAFICLCAEIKNVRESCIMWRHASSVFPLSRRLGIRWYRAIVPLQYSVHVIYYCRTPCNIMLDRAIPFSVIARTEQLNVRMR